MPTSGETTFTDCRLVDGTAADVYRRMNRGVADQLTSWCANRSGRLDDEQLDHVDYVIDLLLSPELAEPNR